MVTSASLSRCLIFINLFTRFPERSLCRQSVALGEVIAQIINDWSLDLAGMCPWLTQACRIKIICANKAVRGAPIHMAQVSAGDQSVVKPRPFPSRGLLEICQQEWLDLWQNTAILKTLLIEVNHQSKPLQDWELECRKNGGGVPFLIILSTDYLELSSHREMSAVIPINPVSLLGFFKCTSSVRLYLKPGLFRGVFALSRPCRTRVISDAWLHAMTLIL